MIKNIKLIILTAIIFVSSAITACCDEPTVQKLREGAFVKVMTLDEFSTLSADVEDEVKFISTSDIYVYETNAIPQNSIFYGEIEDVREPVAGQDGSLKILINKIVTPDKKVYRVKAHIYNENDNYIGGRLTAPIYYRKVPHYYKRLKPMLQMAPLQVYEMGKHTVVKPGAELIVVLEEDIILE